MITVRLKPDTTGRGPTGRGATRRGATRRGAVRRFAVAVGVLVAGAVWLAEAPQVYRAEARQIYRAEARQIYRAEARQQPPRAGGPPRDHVQRFGELRVIEPLLAFVRQLPATDLVAVYYPLDSMTDVHFAREREPALKAIREFKGRRGDYQPIRPVEEDHLRHPRDIESI